MAELPVPREGRPSPFAENTDLGSAGCDQNVQAAGVSPPLQCQRVQLSAACSTQIEHAEHCPMTVVLGFGQCL